MSDKNPTDEEREHFAKGGYAKWSRTYDPNIKGSQAKNLPVLEGHRRDNTGKIVPVDGYPKWSTPNTSTVPNDPANEINRAKGEPDKEAPGVTFNKNNTTTINDGTTDVVVSSLNKRDNPGLGNMPPAKQHYPPCINPTCKSFGKSHPNCLCYAGPGGSSLEQGHFAKGGQVCSGNHHESCEYFASGGQIQEQHNILNNPKESLDNVGAQHGLLHLLTKLGNNGRSENPHKHFEEYVDSSKRGKKALDSHVGKLIGSDKLGLSEDKEGVSQLKDHLNDLEANPQKALDVGGSLSSVLPSHGAELGAKTANALNYFQGLKPRPTQRSPFDSPTQPSKASESSYDRQLSIAQNPMLILEHAKEGTLRSQDLKTLHSIYPALAQSMTNKAGEAIIDAKQNNKAIPYRQKQGLSTLLGQPLDSIQTPIMMQAIIRANGAQSSQPSQGEPKKASGKELDQISKTEDMLATPDQSRLLDKKQ